jgi:hypothetical protein
MGRSPCFPISPETTPGAADLFRKAAETPHRMERTGADCIVNGPMKSGRPVMDIILIQPMISLIAGIMILIWPALLNYVVAAFLIVSGVLGLLPQLQQG